MVFSVSPISRTFCLQYGQFATPAVSVCADKKYKVSFSARRITTSGGITVQVWTDNSLLVALTIASTVFVPTHSADFNFPAGTTSTVLRITSTFTGTVGTPKEVQIDNVVLQVSP
ncbi:hypothetical protein DFH27DRAFT_528976 [Peziza echinospora]|nr:hypothetical protein DFH27DRAFT_528976 [Peziza echinospora]